MVVWYSIKGPFEKGTTSLQRTLPISPKVYMQYVFSTSEKRTASLLVQKVSFILERFHCIIFSNSVYSYCPLLQKGPGYHLDLMIVACLVGLFSILGLPWVVGATVRSIAHVQSLFIYSPCTAPGERPKFLGVKEQRVTLLCMSVLLGLSVLMYQVLEVQYDNL